MLGIPNIFGTGWGFVMSLFRRFFPTRQQRQDAEKARQIIERALHDSKKPKGCVESAKLGTEIRSRLLAVIDRIETELGQLAVAFAKKEGVLLTHPRLIEEMRKLPDGELLESAIPLCFLTPHATRRLNAEWPDRVRKYRLRPNTDEIITEKATLLTAFITHNLDAAIEAGNQVRGNEQDLSEEQEILVKIEEAACWLRVVDELSYKSIPDYRPLFMDFLSDNLAHMLGLQSGAPDLICRVIAERTEEYAQYREWATDNVDNVAGTLLWNAAKHVAAPLGFDQQLQFTTLFSTLFLRRVQQAAVLEFLTGN
jgi:hypothetical protein